MRKLPLHVCSFLMLLIAVPVIGWSKVPVILSTDVGNEIDDQWAITYMLSNSAFDVHGIISAHAPSLPDPSAHSSYKILVDVVERRLGMLTHPPLFEGSSLPLADTKTPRPNSGVDFIVRTSKHFSKENRLVVLTIGAATDVASAILQDPSIVNRINVVAMGFKNPSDTGTGEFNVENDPRSWRVILDSDVPVTLGSSDVCRKYLALNFDEAKKLISRHGPVGAWLWQEYQDWYFRVVKPLRVNDFSKSWVIWDIIVLAYEQGMTTQELLPGPQPNGHGSFAEANSKKTVTWITGVDSTKLWADFIEKLDEYQRTHAVGYFSPFSAPSGIFLPTTESNASSSADTRPE